MTTSSNGTCRRTLAEHLLGGALPARDVISIGSQIAEALATRMIASVALPAGRLDEANRGFEEVIAVQRKHGDIWSLGILLTDLAGLRVLEGHHDDARACTQEAMSVVPSIRDRRVHLDTRTWTGWRCVGRWRS